MSVLTSQLPLASTVGTNVTAHGMSVQKTSERHRIWGRFGWQRHVYGQSPQF